MRKLLSLSLIGCLLISLSQAISAQEFIDISKGGSQICGVTTSNELLCSTSSIALRLEPPASSNTWTQVEVGDAHGCALDLDGSISCWGDNNFNQLDAPSESGFVSIDAGWNHTCATTADFNSVCWGLSDNGRLDVPDDGLPFIELDASLVSTCGLEAAGGIRCWGVSDLRWDPPGSDANVISFAAIATNDNPQVCALLDTGAIECSTTQLNFSGSYTDIAGVGLHVCALTTDGRVECETLSFTGSLDVAAINNGQPVTQLFANQGLCVTDVNSSIACSEAVRTPGAGLQPVSNFITLPSAGLALPIAVVDLTASIYSESTVELFWSSTRNSGDGRVVGADIYRNGELLTRTDNQRSYIDDTLLPNIDYTYEVRIVTNRGDVGPPGNLISVNTVDRSSPQTPGYVQPTRANPTDLNALIYSDTTLELVWQGSNSVVYGYEIYRDHEYLGVTTGTSYLDQLLQPGENYHYDVLAVSEDGNILGFAGVETQR